MKTRIPSKNSAGQETQKRTTCGVVPTVEEIRQRAQELFTARGGVPGHELDDWLRAEQQLKQEGAAER